MKGVAGKCLSINFVVSLAMATAGNADLDPVDEPEEELDSERPVEPDAERILDASVDLLASDILISENPPHVYLRQVNRAGAPKGGGRDRAASSAGSIEAIDSGVGPGRRPLRLEISTAVRPTDSRYARLGPPKHRGPRRPTVRRATATGSSPARAKPSASGAASQGGQRTPPGVSDGYDARGLQYLRGSRLDPRDYANGFGFGDVLFITLCLASIAVAYGLRPRGQH